MLWSKSIGNITEEAKNNKTFLYKKVKNFNQNANRYSEALDQVPNWPDQVLERPDRYSSNNWKPNDF